MNLQMRDFAIWRCRDRRRHHARVPEGGMNGWTEGKRAVERGEYVIRVGGSNRLATWNPTHERWFDGYMMVDPAHVRGYVRLPEFPKGVKRG